MGIPIKQAIKEYKMLHQAKSASCIIQAKSLICSVEDSFIVLGLEDLSDYETLYDFVSSYEYSKVEMILLCRELCRAVAELHSMGIVHGDLSARNFMISRRSMSVKLVDFYRAYMKG